MRKNIVLTLTGADRVGIVESVTAILVKVDGNVDTSRMARLGGEFAMLMLVSIEETQVEALEKSLMCLREQGFQITLKQTGIHHDLKYTGWLPYQVEVHGADHEGIVHKVAHYLNQRGINIETMDTGIVPAPMSGTLFFSMNAVVLVPPNLSKKDWQADLDDVADQLNVEIKVSSYQGK